jgi:predicted nucleotidyltransferase
MRPDTAEVERRLRALAFESRGVVTAVLFGSSARGDAGAGSDVDVAFMLEEPFDPMVRLDLLADVQAALGIDDVDVVILNGLPDEQPLLAARILEEGTILVDRVPAVRIGYQLRVLGLAEDARHLMRLTDPDLRERLDG